MLESTAMYTLGGLTSFSKSISNKAFRYSIVDGRDTHNVDSKFTQIILKITLILVSHNYEFNFSVKKSTQKIMIFEYKY